MSSITLNAIGSQYVVNQKFRRNTSTGSRSRSVHKKRIISYSRYIWMCWSLSISIGMNPMPLSENTSLSSGYRTGICAYSQSTDASIELAPNSVRDTSSGESFDGFEICDEEPTW